MGLSRKIITMQINDKAITGAKMADKTITEQQVSNDFISLFAQNSHGHEKADIPLSQDSERLGGQLPSYYATQAAFETHLADYGSLIVNVKYPPVPLVSAKGDGTSHDNEAINGLISHISNNGGGIVYLPSSTYLINRKLAMKSNVLLLGAGSKSIIKLDANSPLYANPIEVLNVTNSGIQKILIDGNRTNQSQIFQGIYLVSCSDIEINEVIVKDVYGDGVFVGYTGYIAENININKLTINNCSRNEFVIGNAKNVKAENVNITSIDASSGAIGLEKHDVADILDNITLEKFTVSCEGQPIKLITNNKLGNTDDVTLRDFKVTGTNAEIRLSDFDNVTIDNASCKKIEIVGCENIDVFNSKVKNSTGVGIYAYDNALNSRLTQNLTISGCKSFGHTNHGILLQKVRLSNVENNRIYNNSQAGIGIYFECDIIDIVGNVITDTRSTGKTQPHAIKFTGNYTNINLVANTTSGNATGDYDGYVGTKAYSNLNYGVDKSRFNFITPNGLGTHSFNYGDDYVLTWGAFLKAKYFMLSQQYASTSVPNGTIFEDSADSKLKYKNLAGAVQILSN